MQYYSYIDSYEYIYDGGIALEDTRAPGVYLVPAKATTTAPGKYKPGYAQVWRPKNVDGWPYSLMPVEIASSGADGDWYYVEDHRRVMSTNGTPSGGTPYWMPAEGDKNGSRPRYMGTLGPLPNGAVTKEPQPLLPDMQAAKRAEINAGFDAALTASLTMPSVNTPPSTVELTVAIGLFNAEDPIGLVDLCAIHEARRAALIAAVDAATTVDAVQAISVSYAV